jgi:FtsZ-binding cell division protein ZapB
VASDIGVSCPRCAERLQERNSELSDLNGTLRTENDELLRENAKLRRQLEAMGRRK